MNGPNMNTLLWIIQIILGIKLITVTFTHGFRQSGPAMQAAIQKMGATSRPVHYFVAACTFLGTLGLILPGLMGLPVWTVPVAAGSMSVMLLVSIFFHIKFREKPQVFVGIILFAFAVFIVYGRWVLAPSWP